MYGQFTYFVKKYINLAENMRLGTIYTLPGTADILRYINTLLRILVI